MRRLVAAAAAILALGGVGAGCGLGPGRSAEGVSLTVTRDFGTRTLGSAREDRTRGGETVMRLLQRGFRVQTRFGGGFVQSVNGLTGGIRGGRRLDWFFYVNGIESSQGAASRRLHAGDRVWWDHHDWSATMSVPAVVGSFPEPFRSGSEGRRLPVAVACADSVDAACDEVTRRLEAVDVPVARAALAAPVGSETLRLLVGRWRDLRADRIAGRIGRGPGASGVYARFDASGGRLTVLDDRGRAVRELGPRTGLVAATRDRDSQPTWVVTGTDAGGVLAAARALEEGALADHFALAVAEGLAVPLPSPLRSPGTAGS